MTVHKPAFIKKERNLVFNSPHIFSFLFILSAVLFLVLCLSATPSRAQMEDDDSTGILIKDIEFYRPYKPPESEEFRALKERRRQISEMFDAEKKRLDSAPDRTAKNIRAHIDFLENSLKQVDDEITRESGTLVPNKVLQEVTAEFRNKELSLEDMNTVAELVTIAYQERGYILARAYVPEQEIEDGILKIAILEGDVADVKISGQKYYDERVIRRNFVEQMKLGVVREELLEKGLLLTKELPDAETRIVLEPGEERGTANLVLHTEDRPALDWKVDFNNFGSELVGKERYGTTIEITDPWWGSTLSLRGVTGNDPKDSSLTSLDLSIPVSDYGTRLNLTYLDGAYIVGQQLADLGITGSTEIYGLSFSHPIWRKRNQNLTLSFGLDHKYSESYTMDVLQNIDELNTFFCSLDYDSLDRFLGKNLVSLGYYRGSVLPNSRAPATRPNADLRFNHYNVSLARIQKVYGNINVMARASAQTSNRNMLPIEQMAIGGYGTVRGHDTSLFLGDSGFTASVELLSAPPYIADKVILGQRVAQMVQLAAFYDYGRVYYSDPQLGDPGKQRLDGYGAGIRLYYKDLFSFKFDAALPVRKKTENEDNMYYYFMSSFNFTSDEMWPFYKKVKNFWKSDEKEEAPTQ